MTPLHPLLARQLQESGLTEGAPPATLAEWTRFLERANEACSALEAGTKSAFLGNMSHELRTPLNAVIGFARVLTEGAFGALNAEQSTYLGYVLQAGERMRTLVDGLLSLRRLDREEAPLAFSPLDLRAVLDAVTPLVRPMIDEKAHSLILDLPAQLPPVCADRAALTQIVVSLLSNAAKFTPPNGHLRIRATVTADAVRVEIEDDGPGIAAADQAMLFTYFETLGAKHAHHMKGSGISLALTRALVEAHGGSIDVRSTPGAGTVFGFTVPRAEPSEAA